MVCVLFVLINMYIGLMAPSPWYHWDSLPAWDLYRGWIGQMDSCLDNIRNPLDGTRVIYLGPSSEKWETRYNFHQEKSYEIVSEWGPFLLFSEWDLGHRSLGLAIAMYGLDRSIRSHLLPIWNILYKWNETVEIFQIDRMETDTHLYSHGYLSRKLPRRMWTDCNGWSGPPSFPGRNKNWNRNNNKHDMNKAYEVS